MYMILVRTTLALLVVAVLFLSAGHTAPMGGASARDPRAAAELYGQSGASGSDIRIAATPEGIIVTTLGSNRPPEGHPFADPQHYRGVYVFTNSEAVRQMVLSQALPVPEFGVTAFDGKLLLFTELGFAAWVPEPLIPVLEQHPEVERLEWDKMKMPLVLIKDPPITDIFTEEELAQRRAQS